MTGIGRTVARNAVVLMATQAVTWLLTLALTIVLPRFLGAEAVGSFHFANSVWAIAAIIVTFGMDTALTKEIARCPDRAASLFGATVIVRAALFILALGAVLAYLRAFDYAPQTANVVLIIGATTFVWQFIGASQAVLQGLERMEWMSVANIAGKAVHTVLSIALLLLGFGVYAVAAVTIVAALANLAVQVHALRRAHAFRPSLDWRAALNVWRSGLPYLVSGIFLVVYLQLDIVIISLLVDERAVGWYGAADQLYGTLLFIPTVFITAAFPALARLYAAQGQAELAGDGPASGAAGDAAGPGAGQGALPRLMQKSFNLLFVMSVPIGLGVLVVADPLVALLFGPDFAGSGPILALMGIVLILTYQNMLVGQFLISTDRQNRWTIVMAVATLATVPIDLLAVPWCQASFGNGAIGGAISFLITEIGMLIVGLRMLPVGSLGRTTLSTVIRALIAGGVMAAAAWPFRSQFIAVPVIVGAVVYLGLAWLLQVVPRDDRALLADLVRNMSRRLRRRPAVLSGPAT